MDDEPGVGNKLNKEEAAAMWNIGSEMSHALKMQVAEMKCFPGVDGRAFRDSNEMHTSDRNETNSV
jgi:hypothetical protein